MQTVAVRNRTAALILLYVMTYLALISLAIMSAVLQPAVISLKSNVTIKTRHVSIYNAQARRRQNT